MLVLSGYQHGLCDIDGVCLLANVYGEGARFCQENMKRIAAGVAFVATTTRDMICGELAAGGQDGPLGAIFRVAGQGSSLSAVGRTKMDGLESLFEVQFAGLAIAAQAAPVVDAVGQVAVLLNFGQHNPAADGMDGSGRNEHRRARLDGEPVQQGFDAAAGYGMSEGFAADRGVEAADQLAAGIGLEDVPHFGLADIGLAETFRTGIVRMHLDGRLSAELRSLSRSGKRPEGWDGRGAEQGLSVAGGGLRVRPAKGPSAITLSSPE